MRQARETGNTMFHTNKKKARGLHHLLAYEVKVKTLEISSFMEISK